MAQNTSKGEKMEVKEEMMEEEIEAPPPADSAGSLNGWEVFEDYDCTLTQTNIEENNNKFYIIQLLHRSIDNEVQYITWTFWGRVGQDGQNRQDFSPNAASAKKDFEKKFKEKTKNNWSDRENFTAHAGKYTMIEVERDNREGGQRRGHGQDMENMPLGTLSKAQIEKGLKVLEDLRKALGNNAGRQELRALSSLFYTNIPHNSGMRNPPPIISSMEVLQAEKDMLQEFLERLRRRADRPE